MKDKSRQNLAKKNLTTFKARSAYKNIRLERQISSEAGFQSKVVIAWMEGGEIQHALANSFTKGRRPKSKALEIYGEWLGKPLSSKAISSPSKNADASDGYVECLITSNGGAWSIWDYQQVAQAILNPNGPDGPRTRDAIPLRFTIFDPDSAADVWHREEEEPLADRCISQLKEMLWHAAQVYELGCRSIEGFEQVYQTPNIPVKNRAPAMVAHRIQDSVKAIDNAFYAAAITRYNRRKRIDAGVALRQAYMIGRWLMEAEVIISNYNAMKLASQQGVSGQRLSPFWRWVVSNPAFDGKSAKEVFGMLDGLADPDYPGTILHVSGDTLTHGDGKTTISLTSFRASFSRAGRKAV